MKLTIVIDNIRHDIDSTNPEILGKWVVEILGRYPEWNPATYCYVQAQPTFIYEPHTNKYHTDWITDNRVIGDVMPFKNPRDLVTALGEQIERAEQITRK